MAKKTGWFFFFLQFSPIAGLRLQYFAGGKLEFKILDSRPLSEITAQVAKCSLLI
jgi:hypothetical protein